MSDLDPYLTIGDIRPLFCVKGVRKAFAVAELDFDHFLKNGAPLSHLKGRGFDAQLDRVVESIRARSA